MDRKKAGGIHKKKQNRDKQGVGSPQTATAGQPPREPCPDWRADSNDGHGHDLVLLLALLWFGTLAVAQALIASNHHPFLFGMVGFHCSCSV